VLRLGASPQKRTHPAHRGVAALLDRRLIGGYRRHGRLWVAAAVGWRSDAFPAAAATSAAAGVAAASF